MTVFGLNYSQYVEVGEHHIKMPSPPKTKDEILFYNDEDAFWNREKIIASFKNVWWKYIPYETLIDQDATLYDDDGYATQLNKEDSDYIRRTYEQEMDRRENGVFFKNGKEIVWLTGDHYFILVYCKTKRPDKKGDYFDYREYQRDVAYLAIHVDNTPIIYGFFISKAKKTGITNFLWLIILNRSTKTKNVNFGNMNIDQEKGAKTFRDHFMYAFNGLPNVMRPAWKNKSEADGKIILGVRHTSKKTRNTTDNELNTTVMCVATAPHAFDVDVFDTIWYDEGPKVKQNFGDIYRSNNAAIGLQDFRVGKIWLSSYTPEDSNDSFMFCRQLFFDSELRTITPNSNGQTKSKLICYHIPAFKSWWTSFDKYGKCNEIDAARKIQEGRNLLKDRPKELLAETRKFANDKKEAWSTGGAGSVFDNIRLGEILVELEIDQRAAPTNNYIECNLIWKGKPEWEIGLKNRRPKRSFVEVELVPLTKEEKERGVRGKFTCYNDIPAILRNPGLKLGKDEWDYLRAPEVFKYTLGGDPAGHASASEIIEGSKNAFTVMSRQDDGIDTFFRKVASKTLQFRYFARPEMPNEAYEDLVKLIIYTGSLCGIEANTSTMATMLMEDGLGHYMLVKEDKSKTIQIWERWMGLYHETDKQYTLIKTTNNGSDRKERLEMFVMLMKEYLYKPEPGAKDYGAIFPDADIIRQIMDVDITDTKISDLFMCWGYNLLTDHYYSNILLSKRERNKQAAEITFEGMMGAFSR